VAVVCLCSATMCYALFRVALLYALICLDPWLSGWLPGCLVALFALLCFAIPALLRFAVPCFALLALCYVALVDSPLSFAMLCFATLCCAFLCLALPCYVLLCFAMVRPATL